MRSPDTTHKKQSMHVKIVPSIGTYLPKKSMTASFFVPDGTLIAVKLLKFSKTTNRGKAILLALCLGLFPLFKHCKIFNKNTNVQSTRGHQV
jgi:hypothetical protein